MFHDRRDAGRQLAVELNRYAVRHPVVVGLPRGGVVVAAEIADGLHAPLDVAVVRKLGLPWHAELAFGAIAEGDVCLLDVALIEEAGIGRDEIDAVIARERAELERRIRRYRGDRRPVSVDRQTVILVDDGLATGWTARAAVEHLRRRGAGRVVVAVPVAPNRSAATVDRIGDELVALERPAWFQSIGEHYEDFSQTSDEEVVALLEGAAAHPDLDRARRRPLRPRGARVAQ
jgi:predicted phosphoribosyltransferase